MIRILLSLMGAVCLIPGWAAAQSSSVVKPNVLLLIADDLRADVAPYRSEFASSSKRLARFAEESLTFANAYVLRSRTFDPHSRVLTSLGTADMSK